MRRLLTYTASDRNHLQMSALQLSNQPGIRCILCGPYWVNTMICARLSIAFFDLFNQRIYNVPMWISPEGVDERPRPQPIVSVLIAHPWPALSLVIKDMLTV